MAFFFPSSTSTSTTTSLSSSPLPVLRPLDSENESDEQSYNNESPKHDIPTTQSGFAIFGLLSQISGASVSDMSSLEDSSESEAESSWTQRAAFGNDEDRRFMNTMSSRSTREGARSSSRRRHQSPEAHGVVELHGPSAGTSQSAHVHHQTSRTFESNDASPINQVKGKETAKRRGRSSRHRHGSIEGDRNARRETKLRTRRKYVFEPFICTFPFLSIFFFLPFINFLQHGIFSLLSYSVSDWLVRGSYLLGRY